MLSKDEEEKLNILIELVKIRPSVKDLKEMPWICEKLKEVNDELKAKESYIRELKMAVASRDLAIEEIVRLRKEVSQERSSVEELTKPKLTPIIEHTETDPGNEEPSYYEL